MSKVINIKDHQPSEIAKRCRKQLEKINKPMTYGVISLAADVPQSEIAGSAIWAASPLTDNAIQARHLAEVGIRPETSQADRLRLLEAIRGLMIDGLYEHENLIDILETE